MNNQKKINKTINRIKGKSILAFTLIELIISITLITILSTIWFNSYVWHISDARDAERKANIWEIKSALKLYKQKRWAYPIPFVWESFNITNSWVIVAIQWKISTGVTLSTMDNIPTDPLTNKNYFYSVTKNRQETQIALTLEDWWNYSALLDWDYKTVSKNVLPSIILATWSIFDVEIHAWILDWTINRNLFILNWGKNLPYTIEKPYSVLYAWENIDNVLNWWVIKFWQNSDFRTCDEILESAKMIHITWSEEYQILNDSWTLVNTWCIFP